MSTMIRGLMLVALLVALSLSALLWDQYREEPDWVSGFLEADEIRVGSRIGGRIGRVLVEEGQSVASGDVLIELEPYDLLAQKAQAVATLAERQASLRRLESGYRPQEIAQAKARRDRLSVRVEELVHGAREQEVRAAQARLDQAEAELELAQAEHRRVQNLFEDRVLSRDELDRAQSRLRVAGAAVTTRQEELALLKEGAREEVIRQARADLEEAEQALALMEQGYRDEDIESAQANVQAAEAAIARIDAQLDELIIRAPRDAIVEALDLEPGDLVAPEAPVLSLLDPNSLWIRTYLPENRLDIKVGAHVSVRVDSYPGKELLGQVTFVARQGEFIPGNVQTPEDRSKQVFRMKVTLLDVDDVLRPGMAADVHLEDPLKD
ncbi:MAG: HlyD family efflux transporter periplasmic adaptor subunit [Planctomycetota bacterium]